MEIMKSHCDGEVWGLALMENGNVITTGDDNKVMCWDPKTRKNNAVGKVTDRAVKSKKGGASTLSTLPDSQCSRAVAVNSNWIVIAGNDGCVSVRSCRDPHTECHLLKDSAEWIEVMAFSPDNMWLAVGSHDNNIYIYDT